MPNRAGAEARQVTTSTSAEWRSFKWVEPQLVTYKARDGAEVYARLFTPEMVGAKRHPSAPGGRVRARRRLPAERAQLLVDVLPRVHVPSPARVDAATSCSIRTTAPAPATAATGARRSTAGWAARICEDVVDGAKFLVDAQKVQPQAHRRLRRQLRRLHHADGDVHDAGRVRGRRRAAAGDRLGALQPSLHVEHPQRAADRHRGVSQELADLLRRRAEGRAADLPRHGRRQRALPGLGAAGAAARSSCARRTGSSRCTRSRITASSRRRAGPTNTSAS